MDRVAKTFRKIVAAKLLALARDTRHFTWAMQISESDPASHGTVVVMDKVSSALRVVILSTKVWTR